MFSVVAILVYSLLFIFSPFNPRCYGKDYREDHSDADRKVPVGLSGPVGEIAVQKRNDNSDDEDEDESDCEVDELFADIHGGFLLHVL